MVKKNTLWLLMYFVTAIIDKTFYFLFVVTWPTFITLCLIHYFLCYATITQISYICVTLFSQKKYKYYGGFAITKKLLPNCVSQW